jgi:hypothetical protein
MPFVKERYITVTDNWYPCYEGNKVRLRLTLTPFHNKYYVRLAAWGADDTAYVKDFEYADKAQANRQYEELIPVYNNIPDGINKDWFIDRDFTRF